MGSESKASIVAVERVKMYKYWKYGKSYEAKHQKA
jgi:hypothetical protein